MNAIESKLAELGITLPSPAAPVANYVPYVITGNLLVISGQLCFGLDGKLADTAAAARSPARLRPFMFMTTAAFVFGCTGI